MNSLSTHVAPMQGDAPSQSAIQVADDDTLTVSGLRIRDGRVASLFRGTDESEWDDLAERALIVGALAIERASTRQDVDVVRQETDALLQRMRLKVDGFGKELIQQVGTQDGQVLAPVQVAIKHVQESLDKQIERVRADVFQELEPGKETSVVGRALQQVNQLLDPARDGSIQKTLQLAVAEATKRDGELVGAVHKVVTESLRPMQEQVEKLQQEILKKKAAADATQEVTERTTLKGDQLELDICEILSRGAGVTGIKVERVGQENRPGDILVHFPSISAAGGEETIVIEAKDHTSGSIGIKKVRDHMQRAIGEFGADGGVYICRDERGFTKEVGEYQEGDCDAGPWVATTLEHLNAAVRMVHVRIRMAVLQETQPDVDVNSIAGAVQSIKHALRNLTSLKRKGTEASAAVDQMRQIADDTRDSIDHQLREIEGALSRQEPDLVSSPTSAAQTQAMQGNTTLDVGTT